MTPISGSAAEYRCRKDHHVVFAGRSIGRLSRISLADRKLLIHDIINTDKPA